MKSVSYLSMYLGIVGFALILSAAFCVSRGACIGSGAVSAKPKRVETAAPGDCGPCHGSVKMLPIDHVRTKDMTSTECANCHKKGATSLRTKIPLSHTHRLSGVACCDCHEMPNSAGPLKTEKCLSCHGSFEEVADATNNLDPNPHNSLHWGKELDCDLCHHQHAKSENFCAQCHMWGLVVP